MFAEETTEDTKASLQENAVKEESGLSEYAKESQKSGEKVFSVLERIKERERRRKEMFIKNCKDKEYLEIMKQKIISYFKLENKKSENVLKLAKVLSIHDPKESLHKLCQEYKNFILKEFEGDFYLVSINES